MWRVIRTDPRWKPVFMKTRSETSVNGGREKSIELKTTIMIIK